MRNRKTARAALLPLLAAALAAAALLVSPSSSGQDRRRVREDVARALKDFDELSFEPSALLARARKEGRLSLGASRGDLELTLEPFDIRTDDYRAVAVGGDGSTTDLGRAPARWFRGEVAGVEGSRVRLTLDETTFEGVIVTPDETFYVEPARDFSKSASAGDFVFYAASSVRPQAGGGACGTTLAERVGAQAARQTGATANLSAKGPRPDAAFAPKPQTDVATESDFEYTQSFASNPASVGPAEAAAANDDILDILAGVDAIYDAQLGVRIRVVFQRAWTANNDPYTLTAASPALAEFRDSYSAMPPAGLPDHDLVHMFTGKAIDGNIIGIAYTGVACNVPDYAFGISESKWAGGGPSIQRVALTAHEMGHNFGASHPNQENPVPQSCDGVANIMNSFIQPTSSFCQFSLDQITNHVSAEGSCLTRLVQPGCAYSISPASQSFTAAGGTGSVNVTAGDSCEWGLAEGAEWVDTSGPSASGSGAASYTVRANADTGPREAVVDIAGQRLTVRQAAASACGSKPIAFGQTVEGRLSAPNTGVKPAVAGDCRSGQPERPNAFIDLYTFSARAGQSLRVEMSGSSPDASVPPVADTYLYLFGPDGSVVAFNDDVVSGSQTNSRIPLSGFLQLPQTGVYTIEATSFANGVTGGYTLTLSDNAVEFASVALSASEAPGAGGIGADGSGFRAVNVTRSGDTSHAAAVDYATSDGTAGRRKDYEQTLGTLAFAPGETSKSFNVFVVDDALAEGPESVGLTLSNPVGTTLGPAREATLTIDSDDAASASSPARAESFDTAFFVRQQYLDFLGREPDPSGFAFWRGEIEGCGQDALCAEVKRVNVSAAFFLSIEFQNTGFLVYKTYGAAFGVGHIGSTVPLTLEQFLANQRRVRHDLVVGSAGWEAQLEANKVAYFDDFVSRPAFAARYPPSMTAAQFVDALDANAAGGALSASERDQLVADLESGAKTRAQVLRAVAEDPDFSAAQLNRAFVLMEYFAYLRRDPDESPDVDFSGYDFWLSKLNQFGGDFQRAEMVKAFITSDEYVRRFGL